MGAFAPVLNLCFDKDCFLIIEIAEVCFTFADALASFGFLFFY